MSDYPKLIWLKDGREVTVQHAAEVQGYVDLGLYEAEAAPEPAPDADEPDEPTFGPPHDQTHAKRSSKKK